MQICIKPFGYLLTDRSYNSDAAMMSQIQQRLNLWNKSKKQLIKLKTTENLSTLDVAQ